MKYTQNNYVLIPIGDIVQDNYIGSCWKAVKKLRDGVVLQNVSGGRGGVIIQAVPTTCNMEFYSIK